MEVYLDNAATTKCCSEASEIVTKTMLIDYGNPSSMHRKGVEAENYVKDAAKQIAQTMKVKPNEIYFTSGGTESNNWAIIGTAMANRRRGNHIITTAVEHPAVLAPVKFLEEQGFEVTRLGVNKQGVIDLAELAEAIRPETILVSIIYVNNEIGSVQPISEIGNLLAQSNEDIYFHVDAIQGYGKYHMFPKKMKIDLLSASGHKINGPKGVGFLYVDSRVKINPLIHGGGQQNNLRSGTDNVPGISGMGVAAEQAYQELESKREYLYSLKEHMVEGLAKLEDVEIHGMDVAEGAPHIISASFDGVRSEVILHSLEEKGIYVSAGSACATHKRTKSPTLLAIEATNEAMESTIRFSFSTATKREDIDYTLATVAELLPMLRRYTRR